MSLLTQLKSLLTLNFRPFDYLLRPPYSLRRKRVILGFTALLALTMNANMLLRSGLVFAAPSVPGTPSTTSPNPSSTPTWTWTASTGGGAGLASVPYEVRWSQASNFGSGVSTGTAETNSYTHSVSLANGTWYFQVRAVDTLAATSAYSSTGSVYINSNTLTGASAYSGEPGTQIAINDLQVAGVGNPTVPVKLRVASGTLSMTTTTGLSFTGSPTGSTLYFSGTLSDINAALATLRYTKVAAGSDTIEVSLVDYGEVFFEGTNHLYEYVTSTTTWGQARDAAVLRSKYGATGYLTTITSAEENSFVSARLLGAGWMGAADSGSEGDWKWVSGPETGTSFWSGTSTGSAVSGRYANWGTGEPNNAGDEDCAQFLSGGTGKWNDLPCTVTTLTGYVVEYGAPGNMPLVASKNIAITVADVTPPTNPGTPSGVSSPTADNTPTWTWTASTDAGIGLANPAYAVQMSQDPTFAGGITAGTSNTASFTPSSLADGLWYFRVRASDQNGNVSAWATSAALRIDTTAPTVPGAPSAPTPTNDLTPTWTWAASSDSGAGLAATPYSLQWSQSSTFAGGITSGTATANSFTHSADLTEGTWYFRVLATDALGHNSSYSSVGSVTIDSTAVALAEIVTSSLSSTEQSVGWSTGEAASSQVLYGPSSAYGNQTVLADTSPRVTSHAVTLQGLLACTTYHYQVVSVDAAGNETRSSDARFTTAGCAGTAAVVSQTAHAAPSATGGQLELVSGGKGISVSAPANFTNVDTVLQIKKIDPVAALAAIGTPSASLNTVGNYVYDIKALRSADVAITSFDQPVTITLAYGDEDIAGLDEQSLAIYRWNDGPGWQALSGCAVSVATKSVTCTTPGFSTFALFGSKPAVVIASPASTSAPAVTAKKKAKSDSQVAISTADSAPAASGTETPSVEATPEPAVAILTGTDASGASKPSAAEKVSSGKSAGLRKYSPWLLGVPILAWFIFAAKRRKKKEDPAR